MQAIRFGFVTSLLGKFAFADLTISDNNFKGNVGVSITAGGVCPETSHLDCDADHIEENHHCYPYVKRLYITGDSLLDGGAYGIVLSVTGPAPDYKIPPLFADRVGYALGDIKEPCSYWKLNFTGYQDSSSFALNENGEVSDGVRDDTCTNFAVAGAASINYLTSAHEPSAASLGLKGQVAAALQSMQVNNGGNAYLDSDDLYITDMGNNDILQMIGGFLFDSNPLVLGALIIYQLTDSESRDIEDQLVIKQCNATVPDSETLLTDYISDLMDKQNQAKEVHSNYLLSGADANAMTTLLADLNLIYDDIEQPAADNTAQVEAYIQNALTHAYTSVGGLFLSEGTGGEFSTNMDTAPAFFTFMTECMANIAAERIMEQALKPFCFENSVPCEGVEQGQVVVTTVCDVTYAPIGQQIAFFPVVKEGLKTTALKMTERKYEIYNEYMETFPELKGHLHMVNSTDLLADIVTHPERFGIKDVTNPICGTGVTIQKEGDCTSDVADAVAKSLPGGEDNDWNRYMWVDGVHLSPIGAQAASFQVMEAMTKSLCSRFE